MKKILIFGIILNFTSIYSQFWNTNGLNNGGNGNTFGTSNASPINIFTNGTNIARFTQGNALVSFNGNTGDGLRIRNTGAVPAAGNLDLFTSNNNGGQETHAVFGFSGQISGQNNRFEVMSTFSNGLWFNTLNGPGWHKYARLGLVQGFLGTNNNWSFGAQTANAELNGIRKVHVFDNASQLRLSFGPQNVIDGPFTDFFTLNTGFLKILPQNGRVGINGGNIDPTRNLDVWGNVRVRDVPVGIPNSLIIGTIAGNNSSDLNINRLDFPMDNTQVLLGDGTWGTNPSGGNGFALCTQNADLLGESHVNLNDFNLYFENSANQAVNQNLVAIGYDCGSALDAKLNVFSTKEVWSGSFFVDGANPATAAQQAFQGGVKSIIDNTNSESANAVYGYVAPNLQATMISQVGVKGEVDAFQAKEAIGVFGDATISDPTGGALGGRFLSSGSGFGRAVQAQNTTFQTTVAGTGFGFGGDFSCYNPLGTSVGSNTGVVGSADGKAQRNIGVLGRATGNGIFNCGVYGEASGGVSNYAAYFQGNVYVNGGATSGSGYLIASDQQFKNEINNFSNGLEILEEIAPKTYYLDTNNNYGINFPSTLQYGMIAQDVEQVLPSLVSEVTKPASYDSLGNVLTQEITYKSLNYNAFIPILISAVKEQNEKIDVQDEKIDSLNTVVDDLNNRLTQLENCLNGVLPFLCQMSNSSIQQTPEMVQEQIRTAINVNLSDKNAIVLNQNVPNPFAESTVITYSIPATVVKAQIHFYDGQGKLINSVEITSRGAGQLNVFGEDLSSGTYTYTLVADGQIVSTKKMVKE